MPSQTISLPLLRTPVRLDRELHRDLRVNPVQDFSFAFELRAVPLAGAELAEACKHFVTVFMGADGGRQISLQALLGLHEQRNFFVAGDGRRKAGYTPAFLRRYPFTTVPVPGKNDAEVWFDSACAALSRSEGQALFGNGMVTTPAMANLLAFLNAYVAQANDTEGFLAAVRKLDLLTDTVIKYNDADGREQRLSGASVIDQKKLQRLPADQLAELSSAGHLPWLYAHLISLTNLPRLVERLRDRDVHQANS